MRDVRVLVIDDDRGVREVVTRMLRCIGIGSVCCADGDDGLAAYDEAARAGNRFAAVIIDLAIPGGMGGKEIVRRLLRSDPAARAIVTTGFSTDPAVVNFSEYGFRAQITKPFRIEHLEQCLSDVLGYRVWRVSQGLSGPDEREGDAG